MKEIQSCHDSHGNMPTFGIVDEAVDYCHRNGINEQQDQAYAENEIQHKISKKMKFLLFIWFCINLQKNNVTSIIFILSSPSHINYFHPDQSLQ